MGGWLQFGRQTWGRSGVGRTSEPGSSLGGSLPEEYGSHHLPAEGCRSRTRREDRRVSWKGTSGGPIAVGPVPGRALRREGNLGRGFSSCLGGRRPGSSRPRVNTPEVRPSSAVPSRGGAEGEGRGS